MEILHKIVESEVKKLNDLTFEFTASTEDIDRDGEVVESKGWDLSNFKRNPVVTWAHQYAELPIGKVPRIWIYEGKLKNYVEFPAEGVYPFADTVRRLVEGGFLKAESVGFKPYPDSIIEVENGDGIKIPRRRLTQNELLEIAIVPVPSNPNALLEAKMKGIITDQELALITKPEETEQYFRIPVPKEEGKHTDHRVRTIDISKEKGIKALYCGECKVVITYLFSKDKKFGWTMASAEAWIKEHSKEGELPWEKGISQAEIIDEVDYLAEIIDKSGLSPESMTALRELVKRLPGNDIPVAIKTETATLPEPLDLIAVAKVIVEEIARIRGKII